MQYCLPADWIEYVKLVISIIMLFFAGIGLNTWNRQIRGAKKYEVKNRIIGDLIILQYHLDGFIQLVEVNKINRNYDKEKYLELLNNHWAELPKKYQSFLEAIRDGQIVYPTIIEKSKIIITQYPLISFFGLGLLRLIPGCLDEPDSIRGIEGPLKKAITDFDSSVPRFIKTLDTK